jgi:hypothetical protein
MDIMDQRSWNLILRGMIAAGDVRTLTARVNWPLHAALWELHQEAGRRGLRGCLGGGLLYAPSPEVGRRAEGADRALRQLIRDGLLREAGAGLNAQLVVDAELLVQRRRELLLLDPEVVSLLQRAGARWAALAATCSKYVETPATSSMVVSAIA